jgi:quercetin dioxygenase-like cupin family protein
MAMSHPICTLGRVVVLDGKGHTDIHYHPEQEETYKVLEGMLQANTTAS